MGPFPHTAELFQYGTAAGLQLTEDAPGYGLKGRCANTDHVSMKTGQDTTKIALDLFLNKLAGKYGKYLPGQQIFAEGDPGNTMLLVLSGRVRISKRSSDGTRMRVIAHRSAGEFIGEMALVESSPRSATVEAEDACEVLEFNRVQFERAIRQQPALATKVLRSLSRKLRESDDRQVRMLEEANRILTETNHELIGLNSFLDCIIDQTPSAVILATAKGELFRINHAGLAMFELDSSGRRGNISNLFVGFSFADLRKDLIQTWTGQVIGRRGNKPFPVHMSIRALTGHPDGILYLVLCHDISDLEEQIHVTTDYEKFTAAQHAAVEMAHGVCRMLNELHLRIDQLVENQPMNDRAPLIEVRSEADRIKTMVRRLAEDYLVNRCNCTDFSFSDLRQMVRAVVQQVESMPRYESLDLSYLIDDDFPSKLLLRAGQVQSVLLNVIIFVADRLLDSGGRVESPISVRLTYDSENRLAAITVAARDAVISKEQLAAVLNAGMSGDPHDHTLGLGMIRAIVEIHGGNLAVERKSTSGMAVMVRLPLRQTAADHD